MADVVFANGMFVKERDQKTPEFILGRFSFKAEEFIALLNQYKNAAGYVNIDLKKSKAGKKYFEVNTWGLELPPQGAPQAQGAQGYVAQNPPQPYQQVDPQY